MNDIFYGHLEPGLKVGYNCMYMNIAAFFEYKKRLSLAMTFTNADFIYNYNQFIVSNNAEPTEQLISKNNPLIIEGDVAWSYHIDYGKYIDILLDRFDAYDLIIKKFDKNTNIHDIKQEYLEKNIPIIFSCDHYYLYDEYKKITSDLAQYHSGRHANLLLDIDDDEGKCILVDKFFSFMGQVSFEDFKQAIMSEYINNSRYYIIDIKDNNSSTEEENILKYFKRNIQYTLEDTVDINGNIYYKNIKGIKLLQNDFNDIIDEFIFKRGKYAAQFLSNVMQPIRLQRMAYSNLLNYINKAVSIEGLKDLCTIAEESKKLWRLIDILCDKSFISGSDINNYREKFTGVIKDIYNTDGSLYDKLSKLSGIL